MNNSPALFPDPPMPGIWNHQHTLNFCMNPWASFETPFSLTYLRGASREYFHIGWLYFLCMGLYLPMHVDLVMFNNWTFFFQIFLWPSCFVLLFWSLWLCWVRKDLGWAILSLPFPQGCVIRCVPLSLPLWLVWIVWLFSWLLWPVHLN